MRRILAVGPMMVAALAAFSAAPAQADRRGASVASLATPLAAPRQEIVDGVLWKCSGGRCAATSDGSRAVLVCQRVARTFGEVTRFATPAGELSAEEISRCNGAN